MTLSLSNYYARITNRLSDLNETIEELKTFQEDNFDEGVSREASYQLQDIISKLEEEAETLTKEVLFINNQMIDFLKEVRDRKNEGVVIVQELIDVLHLEEI